jgi:DNA-damage-inducible protein D
MADDLGPVRSYDAFYLHLEQVKRTHANGTEYWNAREIQDSLGYVEWRSFDEVIRKSIKACESAGIAPANHFVQTTRMVEIGSGAVRESADWFLTRYACYLIALSGDASKPEIAFAKTYFAVQARRQELEDQLTAEEKRILLRERVKDANKMLASAAKKAGVHRYPVFQDEGYRGLYGGLGQAQIKAKKGIDPKEPLLDCIDRTELAANEFRITQTEQKLAREKIAHEAQAIQAHHEVGIEVRQTIRKIGGTMPEDLPAAVPIRKVLAARKKQLKAAKDSTE